MHWDTGHVEATVEGSQDYDVVVDLDRNGEIIDAYCDCPAYFNYDGYCKHIVAAILYIKDLEFRRIVRYDEHPEVLMKSLIGLFQNRSVEVEREQLKLEVTLNIERGNFYRNELIYFLDLRMGLDRLYVVRNIKQLMESIEKNTPLEFGKNFVFDPIDQYFSKGDQRLIDFIYNIYDIDNMAYGTSRTTLLFRDKYLYLTESSMEQFLHLMEDSTLNITLFGHEYKDVRFIKQDLPVKFSLKKAGEELEMGMDIPELTLPLTRDGRYFFSNGNIYVLPKAQMENLAPFFQMVTTHGVEKIKIPKEDEEKFASFVIPNMKKAGELFLDSGVEEKFYQRPLEASIYLDRLGDDITASFIFNYGDYKIDPFAPKQDVHDNYIVIRDYEKERDILDIFESSNFRINKDMVYLDDEESIYDFITNRVPKLQDMSTVYYSDAFKNMKIYDTSYYTSSIRLNEDSDLLEFSFSIDGIQKEKLPEIFASLREKKQYYRLPDGSFIPLDTPQMQNVFDMMEYLGIDDVELKKEAINLKKYKAMYLDDKLKGVEDVYVRRNMAFKKLVENIREPKDLDYEIPKSLDGIMRGYQITGFKWLKTLAAYGMGGILADDMGLGKTLQTIAFIQSEKERLNLPSIVICPTSLVYNWESEVDRFAPSLKTLVISGTKDERRQQINDILNADIVITSYPLVRRDIELYDDVEFGYCILDEAQHIKNPASLNAKSVKKIRARGYFALTGTPIENNLTELWSIFDFLMPGYLLSLRKFVKMFERPIAKEEDKKALEELNRYVKPFILRRLKKDVLKELPPKIENVRKVDLTREQKQIYLAYLQQIKGEIEEDIRINGINRSRIQILAGLTRLRQICCHPGVFIENYNGGSGKMDALMELLEELKEGGHRVLIFSQFTEVLKLIKEELQKVGITYFYLDGSIKAEERRDAVRSFNQGFRDVFLISLKAGGTGLNLTGADTVIHFDPWWNPAVEEQATDRAYRIGQQSTVHAIKLISRGTIEEKIYALQQKKKELIDSVLQPGETFISKMTEEDIRELFNIS